MTVSTNTEISGVGGVNVVGTSLVSGGGAVSAESVAAGLSGAYLHKFPHGAHSFLNSDGLFQSRAIGYGKGKIVAFDATGSCYRYTPASAAWVKTQASGVLSNNALSMLALTSNGYLFAGFSTTVNTDPQQGKLYRSTDDGTTWVTVFTETLAATKPPNSPNSFVEADNGSLFCSYYPATDTYLLIKSTDNGATWADITANLAQAPTTHIHSIYWCPHRKLLFLCSGDNGNSSKIQVSADYGATWKIWASSAQTTAITSDDRYLYIGLDNANDRQIIRVECPIWVNPAVNDCASVIVWTGAENTAASGFSWWGVARNGLIVFVYGKEGPARIVASSNYGEPGSWEVLYEGTGTNYCHTPVMPTAYAGGLWDGLTYGAESPGSPSYLDAFSVGRKGTSINLDQRDGQVFYDGWARPRKELTGYETQDTPVSVVRSVSESAPTTVSRIDFESGAGAWVTDASVGASVDTGAEQSPFAGAKHLRTAYAAATGNSNARIKLNGQPTLTAGSHWLAANVRLSGGVTPPGDLIFFRLENASGGYLKVGIASGTTKLRIFIYDGVNLTGYTSRRDLAVGQYYRIKARLVIGKIPSASGRLTVWVDGLPEIDIHNIVTVGAAGDTNIPYVGIMGTLPGWVVDADDVVYAQNGDPGP